MSFLIFILCILSQLCLVTGQLFMKHAMNVTNLDPVPWKKFVPRFALGVTALSGWFFLWTGLLQKKDLSYIFPFEGLGAVLILFGAWIFLNEKLTLQSWIGMSLVGGGIALVAIS